MVSRNLSHMLNHVGSAPREKHNTLIHRMHENVSKSRLFHTTSIASRSSRSYSNYEAILPPFASQAFVHTLHLLDVKTLFVPVGEADGVCVKLADEQGGYVLGRDSDFVILIASPGVTRIKGYCPLDMMMWIEGAPEPEPSESAPQKGSKEWSLARPRKTQSTSRQSALLPSQSLVCPTLVLTVISSTSVRQRLGLPASYIPLFASLAGNDYTSYAQQQALFETGLTATQRIEKAARIVREQTTGAPTSRGLNAGDQAVKLVKRIINKLSAGKAYLSEGAVLVMVDAVIEATFQYILPDLDRCCSTYPFCGSLDTGCPATLPAPDDLTQQGRITYAKAQSMGVSAHITHCHLFPDRSYLWSILEDPSGPSFRASPNLREVRRQAYAIAEAGMGGMRWPESTEEEIEVLKQDKALKNLLLGESTNDGNASIQSEEGTLVDEDQMDQEETEILNSPRPRTVVEWGRQGSSHQVSAVLVPLPDLPPVDSIPPVHRDVHYRLTSYLTILSSNTPLIAALPTSLHPLLAVTRLCVIDSASRGNTSLKWRHLEVVAVLKMGLGMFAAWEKEGKVFRTQRDTDEGTWPDLTPRNANIAAQLSAVMMDANLLAQALVLLPDTVKAKLDHNSTNDDVAGYKPKSGEAAFGETMRLTHLIPFIFISGVALHCLLQDLDPPLHTGWRWMNVQQDMLERCLAAVLEGIEESVTSIHKPTTKAKTDPAPRTGRNGQGIPRNGVYSGRNENNGQRPVGPSGRFDLLASLEA